MPTLTIHIPVEGEITSLFDPKVIGMANMKLPLTLNGLTHKEMSTTIYISDPTVQDKGLKNERATKILEYLMNPCIIYTDMPVFGGVVLRVASNDMMTVTELMSLIDTIFSQKDSKQMPSDLKEYMQKRISYLDSAIAKNESSLKDSSTTKKMKQHVEFSLSNYGNAMKYEEGRK